MTTLREAISSHVAGYGASGAGHILHYPSYTADELRPHFDSIADSTMRRARAMLNIAEKVKPIDLLLSKQYQEAFELLCHAGLQRAIRNLQDARDAALNEFDKEVTATRESDRP